MFELEPDVAREDVRIVKYDEYHDSIERSFEDCENQTISYILGGVKTMYMFELLLEIRSPGTEWQHYKPGGAMLLTQQSSNFPYLNANAQPSVVARPSLDPYSPTITLSIFLFKTSDWAVDEIISGNTYPRLATHPCTRKDQLLLGENWIKIASLFCGPEVKRHHVTLSFGQ